MDLLADSYLRVHTRVKRFPAAVETDWSTRIVHLSDEFVVVDKVSHLGMHQVVYVCSRITTTDNMNIYTYTFTHIP